MIDEEAYRTAVLRPQCDITEDEQDHSLELEARVLGLQPQPLSADHLTASISATTVASDSQNPSSAISQSTAPTSCSSSERRHTYQPPASEKQPISPSRSVTPSLYSYTGKKASVLRNGFRKIARFRKRRSAISTLVTTPTSREGAVENTVVAETESIKPSLEGSLSAASQESSLSTSTPPVPNTNAGDDCADHNDDGRRIVQCVELHKMQARQRDERGRFLEYQRKCLDGMRVEHERVKKQRIQAQAALVKEAKSKACKIMVNALVFGF
jgi:hypothetical protein